MTIRRIVFVLFLLLGAVLALRFAWRLAPRLQYNRAVYAMNHGRYVEANTRMQELAQKRPGDDRALLGLGEVLLRQGNIATAEDVLNNPTIRSSRKAYLLAIAKYQRGQESQALPLFESFVSTQTVSALTPTEQGMCALAVNALQHNSPANYSSNQPAETNRTGALEQMLWQSWTGRAAFQAGDWKRAFELLQAALANNDRNTRTETLACSSAALYGDFSSAQYYIDTSTSTGATLASVREAIAGSVRDQQTSTIATQDLSRQLYVTKCNQRADFWLRLQHERHGLASPWVSNLHSVALDDPIARMIKGDLLWFRQRLREAYSEYTHTALSAQNLQLLLRERELSGQIREIPKLVEEFAGAMSGAIYISAGDTTCTATIADGHVAQFREPGQLSATFNIQDAREYRVTIVAASDHAANLGPLIQLQVDKVSPKQLYIAREGWDCYCTSALLSQGNHKITIEYSREADAISIKGENRTLYILGLIIDPLPVAFD